MMRFSYSFIKFLPILKKDGHIVIQKCYISKKEKNFRKILERAADYCDKVYPPIYGEKWKRIKKALFMDAKYGALVNNFSDTTEIVETFESLGAYNVGKFYTETAKVFDFKNNETVSEAPQENLNDIRPSLKKLTDEDLLEPLNDDDVGRYPEEYKLRAKEKMENFEYVPSKTFKTTKVAKNIELQFGHLASTKLKGSEDFLEEADVFDGLQNSVEDLGASVIVEKEPIKWPEHLKFYSFVKGEVISEFPSPLPSKIINTFTHYLMNGASILPVLALDVNQGEDVLDMCAAPGGKSLGILQTFKPRSLVCNDISLSRMKRIQYVMDQYIPKELTIIWNNLSIINQIQVEAYLDHFDKVLVDAPCLNDRLSLQEPDNNIFKNNRIEERLRLPEYQADLIVAALKMTKPGGCVVYSTCTLSPLQNDGAVHLALAKIWRETKIDCTVVNMNQTVKNLNFMYAIGFNLNLRYGHIVLPFPDNNCGPMYVSKIIRDR